MSCCHSNTIQLYYKFLVGRDGLVASPSQANVNALDVLRADNTWGPIGNSSADNIARSQIVSAVLQDAMNFSNVSSSNSSQSMLISTADSKAVSAASGGGGGGGGSAVTSIIAGAGISVDHSTGNVTVTATGGGGGGVGDVVGPSGAVADRVALFNGTTGKLIKDGGAIALNGVATSAGAGDAGKVPLLNSSGVLDGTFISPSPFAIQLSCSDLTSALTAATNKAYFRSPKALTLTGVRISVLTAPTGSKLIVDIKKNGTTMLSTLLSIDISALTSVGASVPAVISVSSIASDDMITIDVTQVGSTIAGAGLIATLIVS